MRARGASVTDIVVLVVAADDGVMPQTIEAIRHAKAANAPIIVAINKMDKPDANPDRVRQELLQPRHRGRGDGRRDAGRRSFGAEEDRPRQAARRRSCCRPKSSTCSANPDRAAEGSVIESRLDRGRGPVATVLVQKGTLHQGDIVVAGAEWGRVRAMLDDKGQQIKDAGPSAPVEVLGLAGVPMRRRAVRGGRGRGPRARDQRVPPAQACATRRPASPPPRAARWTRCWPASRPASRRKSPSSSRPTCRAAPRRSRRPC